MAHDPIAIGCGVVPVPYGVDIPPLLICHYCGNAPATTRDHIVARSKLGSDAYWNLVPSCKSCNARKADGSTWCHCAFCTRASFLWDLGHRRHKSAGKHPFYKVEDADRPKPRKRRKKNPEFAVKAPPLPPDLSHEAYLRRNLLE